jgi:UDPglucose 6-dehydrogenase
MKIGFVGLGKLGLPVALAIEEKGHTVLGYDVSPEVIGHVRKRYLPYREVDAQPLLDRSDIKLYEFARVVEESDIIFVAVQTPHDPMYEGTTRLPTTRVDFDYGHLAIAIEDIATVVALTGEDKVVVIISTVLPGTIEREIKPLLCSHVKLCYNPFFIAMGTTIPDFLDPEFVLLGVDDKSAAKKVMEFYATIHDKRVFATHIKNAELIKVLYNTYISSKIGFINTAMELCHKTGADIDEVSEALFLATDRVISTKYLRGGMGDGGGCHPRDNIALSWLARRVSLSYDWFEHIMIAREKQTEWLARKVIEQHDRTKLPIVIMGKSFKEETNITVGSPSILLKNILQEKGHHVLMYDPHIDGDPPLLGPSVFFIGTKHEAFIDFPYPENSYIIDPWRYIPNRSDLHVIRIGEYR